MNSDNSTGSGSSSEDDSDRSLAHLQPINQEKSNAMTVSAQKLLQNGIQTFYIKEYVEALECFSEASNEFGITTLNQELKRL